MYKIKRFTKYSEGIEWAEDENSIRRVNIEYSKKYEKDISNPLVVPYNKIIKSLIKGIRSGNLYDDISNEETHMLGDFSKKDKFLMYSKKIIDSNGKDTFNRLNYAIYKPQVEIDNQGFIITIYKVVIQSIKGHERLGTKGYSEIED